MLNEKIRELRKEKGLSLEDLAEKVGTSRQTIYRYEIGAITNIPSEKIEAMAKALGTTPQALMGWESGERDEFPTGIPYQKSKVVELYCRQLFRTWYKNPN